MVDPGTGLRCPFSGRTLLAEQGTAYGLIEGATIGVRNGRIEWIASDDACPIFEPSVKLIEGNDALMTPGLIDCHTHLVYGGNRAVEWEMRLNGASYQQIAREGGGILSTVRATRAASEDELFHSASKRLSHLMAEGVTTIEIKSGYGLEIETELKMLRVARRLGESFPITVEPTLLGAHAVPPEFAGRGDEYLNLVCDQMIPAAKEFCTSVDAFCESIAFTLSQTRRVFEAAIAAGLRIKVHAEQLTRMGAAVLAAEMGALSADHLEYLSQADCAAMKETGTVATLLPGAFYCLNETQKPPVDALRKFEIPIAIATDCNPGSSPIVSLLLTGNMACNLFALTPEEALAGITRNASVALGLGEKIGTLEPGKQADLAVWNVRAPAEIFYGMGHAPCIGAFKGGKKRVPANGNQS